MLTYDTSGNTDTLEHLCNHFITFPHNRFLLRLIMLNFINSVISRSVTSIILG